MGIILAVDYLVKSLYSEWKGFPYLQEFDVAVRSGEEEGLSLKCYTASVVETRRDGEGDDAKVRCCEPGRPLRSREGAPVKSSRSPGSDDTTARCSPGADSVAMMQSESPP